MRSRCDRGLLEAGFDLPDFRRGQYAGSGLALWRPWRLGGSFKLPGSGKAFHGLAGIGANRTENPVRPLCLLGAVPPSPD